MTNGDRSAHRDIERLRVVNFVSTMRLTTHFDSERFVYGAPAIEYNPNSFVAMKLRWNARAVALVFAGRQSVMPGSRSGAESRMAILRLMNTLMDGGGMMNVSEFVVQNLVCHGWFEDEVGAPGLLAPPLLIYFSPHR